MALYNVLVYWGLLRLSTPDGCARFLKVFFFSLQVCTPKTEEKCEPVEPKNVCETIVKLMSYPVPVLVCN